MRRIEVAETLHLVIPQPRRIPRSSDQRDLAGFGGGDGPAIHADFGQIQRTRGHLHHGGGGTPRFRLAPRRAGGTALDSTVRRIERAWSAVQRQARKFFLSNHGLKFHKYVLPPLCTRLNASV